MKILIFIIILMCSIFIYKKLHDFKIMGIYLLISLAITVVVLSIDYNIKTTDKEVWSGYITSVEHKEEWDELITKTETDEDGETHIKTYIEHHDAENYIKTSDNGKISVNKSLDKKIHFNDSFPNTTKELEKFYPIGTPTASIHRYKNKVQSSYSIYKHKNINLKDYKELPQYPNVMKNNIQIDRFIGNVKNKNKVINCLNQINSNLNNKKNNKQVNLIFVNLGNKSKDYGFALQDYWEGGNKNDFVVAFGSKNNKVTWCYPFSWADNNTSERLKINVRNYMLKVDLNNDFSQYVIDIGEMVKTDFKRKEFADFEYINIEFSLISYIIIIILNIIITYIIGK